jgi:hypothetical protein
MGQGPNLKKLDLSFNDALSPLDITGICGDPPTLECLTLSGMPIDQTRAQRLAQSSIQDLVVSRCRINDVEARELARGQFRSLDVSHNPFGDAGTEALAGMAGLESLDASHCRFTPVGAQRLLSHPDVEKLIVNGNKAVGELLREQGLDGACPMSSLTAHDCDIDDDGALLLAQQPFRRLDLRGNPKIGDRGKAALRSMADKGCAVFFGELPTDE